MRKKNEALQRIKYLLLDILSAAVSYVVLFAYRKKVIEPQKFGAEVDFFLDNRFYQGLVLVTTFWILLYWLTGFYNDIYRRSRLKDLINTFVLSLGGSIVVFFAAILDDEVATYTNYYNSFVTYFSTHFLLTASCRTLITTFAAHKIQNRLIGFPTLIIGSNQNAVELYNELERQKRSAGNEFVGFVSVNNNIKFLLEKNLPYLGVYTETEQIIRELNIEEVILAIETREHSKLEEILNILENTPKVKVKMIPDTYDIISGQVRLESLGAPLMEIKHELMPLWQRVMKRLLDVLLSGLALLLSAPVFIFCMLMVRFGSPGPIFFKQERVGIHGKKFNILKFRSMVQDAEKMGPQLSSEDDSRITPFGRIMRKYRLDELPQFFNVIIGEMSIVGPRPERLFYIEQIVAVAPHYKHLQKVKPGITSWGMVKFGYAENVEEMVQRLKYDIIYIENMNLLNDLKILIYTVLIVIQGRGK